MPRISNKKIEFHYFKQFCQAYQLPVGDIIHKDKPDIIIDGNKKIGIELTNSYIENGTLPESEQHQKKGREDVLSKAQQQYLAKNGKRIEISFSFNKACPIRNKNKLIDKIVDLANHIEAFVTGAIRSDIFKHIPELDYVYVNSTLCNDPKWRVLQVYTGSTMSPEKIGELLSDKEKKATQYIKCDEYWLLIIVDFADAAQDQEIPTDVLTLRSDIFKKIIIYKTVFNQILEIPLYQRSLNSVAL